MRYCLALDLQDDVDLIARYEEHHRRIWPEIAEDGAGLVDADTVEGTERLLRRWFELSPAEQHAIAQRARPSFVKRYAMNRAAAAINRVFESVGQDRPIAE